MASNFFGRMTQARLARAGTHHQPTPPARPITTKQRSPTKSLALDKSHCWLTNRINAPATINGASRIPTTNEMTGCRLSGGFDPAPFCAAPSPNQERSLSIERYLAHNPRLLPTRIRHDVVGGVG